MEEWWDRICCDFRRQRIVMSFVIQIQLNEVKYNFIQGNLLLSSINYSCNWTNPTLRVVQINSQLVLLLLLLSSSLMRGISAKGTAFNCFSNSTQEGLLSGRAFPQLLMIFLNSCGQPETRGSQLPSLKYSSGSPSMASLGSAPKERISQRTIPKLQISLAKLHSPFLDSQQYREKNRQIDQIRLDTIRQDRIRQIGQRIG